MAIHSDPAPEGVREALTAALEVRLERRGLKGMAGSQMVTYPVPRFVLPPRAAPVARHMRFVSWDYYVIAGDHVALASMRPDADNLAFAGIVQGPLAERALQAAMIGQARLLSAHRHYRPRFVESGPAGIFSLLFIPARGGARYIDIVDGSLISASALRLRKGVSNLLQRISERTSRKFSEDEFLVQ